MRNDDLINERLDAIELLIEEITEEVAILREALNSYAPRGNQNDTNPAEQTEESSAHDGGRLDL